MDKTSALSKQIEEANSKFQVLLLEKIGGNINKKEGVIPNRALVWSSKDNEDVSITRACHRSSTFSSKKIAYVDDEIL